MSEARKPVALAGATGYIGGLLARHLEARGVPVRALARSPEKAGKLGAEVSELRRADVLERGTLGPALEGTDVAYYLVHSMGRGSADGEFAERDLTGARNFRDAAAEAGVRRMVYMGGLGDTEGSEHLRSRHETAEELGSGEVPVVYLRAAAVIGAGSESFRMVRHLVKNLPAMITPRWVDIRTQPIAIADVISYLSQTATLGPEVEREIEIGGPDVVTYGGMMDAVARASGKRPPRRISVPLLTPSLSSLWVGLVTPVDTGVARPLINGLTTETVVKDPAGMERFDVTRTPLDQAMQAALTEERTGSPPGLSL